MILQIFTPIAYGVDIVGCLILLWGFVRCLYQFLKREYQQRHATESLFRSLRTIRFELASYLLLGLEFMIVGDIIHTILEPSFEDLAVVTVIVGLRTMISFFLGKELEALDMEKSRHLESKP
jgi:uncharacterized membrane protein